MTKPWQVFPALFIERLQTVFGEAQATQILDTLCVKRPTTLRANTLKITVDELVGVLTAAGVTTQPVSWYDQALIVQNTPLSVISELPVYTAGQLYVQSLSSMIPPLVLEPKPGEKILDVAAAPGSKTTQMAMMMNNQGEILANDTSLVRLFKLQANLTMQGVDIVKTSRGPGQELWKKYPEYFDRSLVDVPCSMEGRFACDKPKTYLNWSPKKNKELSLRQRALLRSAVSCTKPGGVIVYSTCTLSPEENELVVDWLLKKEGGAVVVESVTLPGLNTDPALTSWKHKVFDPQLSQTLRILPTPIMEGFYVAKLRKLRSTLYNP